MLTTFNRPCACKLPSFFQRLMLFSVVFSLSFVSPHVSLPWCCVGTGLAKDSERRIGRSSNILKLAAHCVGVNRLVFSSLISCIKLQLKHISGSLSSLHACRCVLLGGTRLGWGQHCPFPLCKWKMGNAGTSANGNGSSSSSLHSWLFVGICSIFVLTVADSGGGAGRRRPGSAG